jgi:hypothetical protein
MLEAAVVRRVDDPLVEVVGPRMGAGGGEAETHPLGEGEEPAAAVALQGDRLREPLGAAGADLDLGVDQLAGRRLGEHLVPLAGSVEVLEAVLELERLRVDDRELLLEPDSEVRRALEGLPSAVEVQRRHRLQAR